MKSPLTLRRILPLAAVLLVFALVFVAPAAADTIIDVNSQDELNTAIINANGPTEIRLTDGTYTLPSTISSAQAPQAKELTFTGSNNAVIEMSSSVTAADSIISFDGVTVRFPSVDYPYYSLAHTAKVVYKNCIFSGTQTMYAPVVEFINCTFDGNQGIDTYYVKTYAATDVTFTDCTFITGGKAILVYSEYEVHAKITLENCKFSSDDTSDTGKGAVEIRKSYYSDDSTYKVSFNDCTEEGFDLNNSLSPLWGNKNSMDADHLYVVEVNMDAIADSVTYGQQLDYIGKVTFETKYGNGNFVPTTYEWYKKDSNVPLTEVPTDAGEYQLKVTANEVNGYAPFGIKDVTIQKATISVTPDVLTKVYGETEPAELTYTYSGNIEGENPAFKGALSRAPGEDVGTYLISLGTLEHDNNITGNFKAANYNLELSAVPVSFTIEEKLITVTPDTLTKVYGEADPVLTYTYSGNITGEIPAFNGVLSRAAGEDAGTYMISLGTLEHTDNSTGNFKAANYKLALSAESVYFTISPKQDDEPVIPDVPDTPRGSSVWLTETPTPTPTPSEPTQTETPTETPIQPGDDDNDDGIPLAALIGGGAVLLIIAGLGAWFVIRRK